MSKKENPTSIILVAFITALAIVELCSWSPHGSYLRNLFAMSMDISFYMLILLLTLSAIAIATSRSVTYLLRTVSCYIWCRSSLPIHLSEAAKKRINFIIPGIAFATALWSLFNAIPLMKDARYSDALFFVALLYHCVIIAVVSKAFCLPDIQKIRFGGNNASVVRKEVTGSTIFHFPDNGITYTKRRGQTTWSKLANRFNCIQSESGDTLICINADRFFFSERLLIEGASYRLTLDFAVRPNIEAFPVHIHTTSMLALEKFSVYNDIKRINIIKAHLSGIKTIVEKELALHKGLLIGTIKSSIMGNPSYSEGGNLLLEDKRQLLDNMRLAFSKYVSNAVMGSNVSNSVCHCELSISGFEIAGLLKEEVETLKEGVKSGMIRKTQLDMEILKTVAIHGPSVLENISALDNINYNGQQRAENNIIITPDTPERKRTLPAHSYKEMLNSIASELKRRNNLSLLSPTTLYHLFSKCRLIPEIMPGLDDNQVKNQLEHFLGTPYEAICDPESSFYNA